MEIEQLKQEEKELTDRLVENKDKQRELNRIAFVAKYSVDVGDTVEWTDFKTQKKGVVSRIEFAGTIPYWYHAFLFNSDGKLGKIEMRIWKPESIKKVN